MASALRRYLRTPLASGNPAIRALASALPIRYGLVEGQPVLSILAGTMVVLSQRRSPASEESRGHRAGA